MAVASELAKLTVTIWLLAPGQAHCEDRVDCPVVAFGHGHVIDAQARQRVIVSDGSQALSFCDCRIGGIAQIHEECFVRLGQCVPFDEYGDCLVCFTWQRTSAFQEQPYNHSADVAVPAVVAKLTVTVWLLAPDRLTVKTALVVPLLPSVTVTSLMLKLGGASSLRMVPKPCGYCDGRIDGIAQVHEERFIRLGQCVPFDQHRDRLACFTRSERQRSGSSRIITRGGGGPIGAWRS